ncbi:MAG: type I-E CRISPR-associated protein Cse1/CasA, partial [Finegoldia magna]|nr:type I-E CRISPR-associated protein Cse1/CasA [Finegoldia magna]
MSEFNLLDEKWIPVIDNDCNNLNVSILELFKNASKYISIAGDTEVQTISITRFLLSILQTVFSRFDENGEEYGYFGLNDMFKQKTEIDPNVIEDYVNDLNKTWTNLWEKKSFPKIVENYLNKYHDRFYLYDDEYPFYQVSSN